MKKLITALISLFTVAGIIQLLSASVSSIGQLIRLGNVADPDGLQFSAWIILPTILGTYASYRLLKDPTFFNRYKKTLTFFGWGIILTIIATLIMFTIVAISGELMGLIIVIGVMGIGSLLSFILALIGWFFDRNK
jgi:hypothetical protein